MRDLRLGSILDFEIRIDVSWFVILFLILWSFSEVVFPAQFPGRSPATYLLMGATGTLLFFLSLLAHELSHSVVARAKGIPVEGITLFIFGGMARTRSEAKTPEDELAIAGVGPLSSLLIGALFGAIAWASARAGWEEAVGGVAAYLAWLNVLLASFNLLPGFPLDGGRLFRALVWKLTGNLTRATRWATRGGQGLGYALMGLGALQAFAGAVMGGLWLLFIGWFLWSVATSSYQQHLLGTILSGVFAREVMTEDPETVPPELSLAELVEERFLRRRFQSFPVVEGERLLGLITLQQVKEVPRQTWDARTVGETMIPADEKIVVGPEWRMTDVLRSMQESGSRRLLVATGDRLQGIISATDIAGWVQRSHELEGLVDRTLPDG